MLGENPARVGYLLKDRVWDGDSFADAVRRVAEGGSALDPEVVSHMLGHRRLHEPFAELTPREQDVPGLMAEGRSNQAIADTLVISGRAVEKHVSGIFTKLNPPYANGCLAAEENAPRGFETAGAISSASDGPFDARGLLKRGRRRRGHRHSIRSGRGDRRCR